jgi:hypothetical protein
MRFTDFYPLLWLWFYFLSTERSALHVQVPSLALVPSHLSPFHADAHFLWHQPISTLKPWTEGA